MLKNAYLLAKIGADTAENERNFAEMLPKIVNYPTGPSPPRRPRRGTCTSRGAEEAVRTAGMRTANPKACSGILLSVTIANVKSGVVNGILLSNATYCKF